jgi:hypothetical protein
MRICARVSLLHSPGSQLPVQVQDPWASAGTRASAAMDRGVAENKGETVSLSWRRAVWRSGFGGMRCSRSEGSGGGKCLHLS